MSRKVGVLEKMGYQDQPDVSSKADLEPAKPKQPSGGRPSKLSLQNAQRDLNERQLRFCSWLATPEKYRQPNTYAGLAASLGVAEVTLWRWAKNPKVIAATRWMVLHHAGDPARIGKIIDILFEIAGDDGMSTRHRIEAAREFLAATGVKQAWKNPTPELLNVKDVDEIDLDALTDEEVWELYNERAGNNGELGSGEFDVRATEVTDGEIVDDDDHEN